MNDDDDNDDRLQDEDEQDRSMKSYSKRKHFGKTTRDIKLLAVRSNVKFQRPSLRSLRIALENNLTRLKSTPSHTLKLKHKDTFANVKCKSKMSINWSALSTFRSWDFNNLLSYQKQASTISCSCRANNKGEIGAKLTQTFNVWDNWKLKGIIDSDFRPGKDSQFSFGFSAQKKRSLTKPFYIKYLSQYSDAMGLNFTSRLWGRKKGEAFYRGHITSGQGHKFFFEHKLSHDSSQGTINNALTASYQDSLGIGTLNGHVFFENKTVKTKEFRFVIEFYKSLAFGVQRRNQVFQLMFLKTKTGYSWLKKMQLTVGNRGLLAGCQGKIKSLSADYALYYKLRQIQNNIYDDSSFGLTLRLNP